jgi:hypothetical protein
MAGTKRVKLRNKVVPLEKVNAGSRWWLDSDFPESASSKDTIEDIDEFEYGLKDSPALGSLTYDFGSGLKFIYIKCKDIQTGTVSLSFDGTNNTVIKLEIGEGFAARLDPTADIRLVMSGESGIEFLTGT